MRISALIFDVDGTLADTEAAHLAAFNCAFEALGRECAIEGGEVGRLGIGERAVDVEDERADPHLLASSELEKTLLARKSSPSMVMISSRAISRADAANS